jgi:hypothetical protein
VSLACLCINLIESLLTCHKCWSCAVLMCCTTTPHNSVYQSWRTRPLWHIIIRKLTLLLVVYFVCTLLTSKHVHEQGMCAYPMAGTLWSWTVRGGVRNKRVRRHRKVYSDRALPNCIFVASMRLSLYFSVSLLLLANDVELNPGPVPPQPKPRAC